MTRTAFALTGILEATITELQAELSTHKDAVVGPGDGFVIAARIDDEGDVDVSIEVYRQAPVHNNGVLVVLSSHD